jgi:MacB-like periplasmic core domain
MPAAIRRIEIVGQPTVGRLKEVNQREVSADYFTTLQVRLLRGRFFRVTEDVSKPRATIINSVMATRYFPGEDPIGKRIRSRRCALNSHLEFRAEVPAERLTGFVPWGSLGR